MEESDMVTSQVGGELKGFRKLMQVETKTIKFKAIFVMMFAAYACVLPFQSLVLSDWGITSAQIGILGAFRPALGAIGAPLLSSIADKTHQHKPMLIVSMILAAILRFANFWIAHEFWQLVVLCIFLDISASPVENLLNNSIVSGLDDPDDYGKQRLWGAVGWGIAAVIFGSITTYFHSFEFLFYAFLFFMLSATALVAWKVDVVPPKKSENKPTFFQSLKVLFTSLDLFIFFFVVAALGAGNSIHQNFFFLYLQELGATESLMGSTLTVTCAAELPFFFFSAIIIKKLTPKGILATTLFLYASRLIYYWGFLYHPYGAYPSEVVHGITFACFYSAAVSYSASIAPPGLEATTQAMVGAMFGGVGPVIGGLLGGWTYTSFGSRLMFLYTGLGLYACLVLFGLSQLYIIIRRDGPSRFTSFFSRHTNVKFSKLADGEAGAFVIELEEDFVDSSANKLDDDNDPMPAKVKRAGSGVLG